MARDYQKFKKPEEHQADLRKILSKNGFETISELLKEENSRQFVNASKEIMDRFARHLSSSQLRNIYDKVLTTKDAENLQYLRPKVAYMAARQNTTEAKGFVLFLDEIMDKVTDASFQRFLNFFEALVAYHKFYNPKNN